MLAQILRASRPSLTRAVLLKPTFTRAFIVPTAPRQGPTPPTDLVQEIYLNQLKGYKPTPIKSTDSEGQVKKWATPSPPPSPETLGEASLAEELKAYENQEVEVEGQAVAGETGSSVVEEDWFEEDVVFAEEPSKH